MHISISLWLQLAHVDCLGFQMHLTDIFLEELAKVGGDELGQEVVNMYLQPFIKVRNYIHLKVVKVGILCQPGGKFKVIVFVRCKLSTEITVLIYFPRNTHKKTALPHSLYTPFFQFVIGF